MPTRGKKQRKIEVRSFGRRLRMGEVRTKAWPPPGTTMLRRHFPASSSSSVAKSRHPLHHALRCCVAESLQANFATAPGLWYCLRYCTAR